MFIKGRAIFATNGEPNQKQSFLSHTNFPALGAVYMYLVQCGIYTVVIGQSNYFVFSFTQFVENRSRWDRATMNSHRDGLSH